MTRFPCTVRGLLTASLTIQLASATPWVLAGKPGSLHCAAAPGSSPVELRKRLDDIRTNDAFYRQLVAWKGAPSACQGSVGSGPEVQESRLALSWPDGSSFEQTFTLPEIFVLRYRRPEGLGRAAEVVAALRAYAAQRGLDVDWTSPHADNEGGTHIVEYRDPAPGVNGIVRLFYDRQQRLVTVSLSLAP